MLKVVLSFGMARIFTPWRSPGIGLVFAFAVLVFSLPIYFRMPSWADLTLYDACVANLFNGGTLDREVFDTNLPGFILVLSLVRAVGGWGTVAPRVADVLILAAIVALLMRLTRSAGATRGVQIWAVVGVVVFYPLLPEICHSQRDVWMLLPSVGAVVCRYRRLAGSNNHFWCGVLEGCLWAMAVWFKPHALIPAAMVWLASARAINGGLKDILGQFTGGISIGALGMAWLHFTGAWPYLYEVFQFWNQGYMGTIQAEFPFRLRWQFRYFPIWSLLQPLAIILAMLNVRTWWKEAPQDPRNTARGMLAVLYLAWFAQALLLQRGFEYIHVPEVLLGIFVFAANSFAPAFGVIVWIIAGGLLHHTKPIQDRFAETEDYHSWLHATVPLHPIMDSHYHRLWPQAFENMDEDTRRNLFSCKIPFHAKPDWHQIREVANYLKTQGVGDGQLVCWHDSCHVLYRELNVRPGCRFMHVSSVTSLGKEKNERVKAELEAALGMGQRIYAVADLNCALFACEGEPSPGPGKELPGLSMNVRKRFPFEQTPVYRSGQGQGRYVVFEVTQPLGVMAIVGE